MYETIKVYKDYALYSLDGRYGICYVDYKNTEIKPIVDHNGMFFNDEVERIFETLE